MAIQVNGTQVIGNSRELTNIASVDATTATAIGAAGVGGQTTEVAKNAAFGTGNVVKLTLGNYKVQTFDIYNLEASGGASLKGRFTDSSDNVVTGNYQYFNTTVAGGTTFSDDINLFDNYDLPTSSSVFIMDLHLKVYDAYSSTKYTRLEFTYPRHQDPGTSYPDHYALVSGHVIIRGLSATALRNQSLYFTIGGGAPTFSSGITYDSYGMGTS